MIEIHPEILKKDNKNESAIPSYDEFQNLLTILKVLKT